MLSLRLESMNGNDYVVPDLEAWKLSMELAEAVYELTKNFPRDEIFGLSAQLRRAAWGSPPMSRKGIDTVPAHITTTSSLRSVPTQNARRN
jgi:23S rRNA-intervening sequence protein